MLKRLTLLLLLPALALPLPAQLRLSLESCIEKATTHNLSVLSQEQSRVGAEANLLQKKLVYAPTVNGFMQVNKGIGTQVDNFTQTIAQSPLTASPGLSAQLNLFQGFANYYNLKQAEYNLAAQEYSLERIRNDLRLNVTLAFFQCLYDQENLRITTARQQQLKAQLERAEKQFAAGLITEGDVYSFRAQAAAAEVERLSQDNVRQVNLLNLLQLMNEAPADSCEIIAPPSLEAAPGTGIPEVEEVYAIALDAMPTVREKKMKVAANGFAVRSARGAYLPSLNLTWSAGSFYSSNSREQTGFDFINFRPIYGNTIPLFTQLNNNFGQQVGLNLSVPIFNGYRARQAVLSSELSLRAAELEQQSAEQQLYRDVQRAVLDARAAQARVTALETQLAAQETALNYARSRYDAGLMDYYAFMEPFNALDRARRDLVQARYDCLIKLKVLDLYQGKPLQF